MTHEELIAYINDSTDGFKHEHLFEKLLANTKALRAVVELHKPNHYIRGYRCRFDDETFPCTTIQVIEKALNG